MLKDLFSKRNPEKPLVFASKTRFGKLTLRKPWEKALKEAKIENFRVHDSGIASLHMLLYQECLISN